MPNGTYGGEWAVNTNVGGKHLLLAFTSYLIIKPYLL